ncbi:hypothetical protein MIR68_001173 [Amoeboaphelidium protococcarum]|nr:hypothetical protein MIR68_001173 [Amoeboaphelidium protococcarum]
MRLLPATKSRFNKTLDKRLPMLKNLVSQLLMKEQVITTHGRADAIRPIVQMIIDNARKTRELESAQNASSNKVKEINYELNQWTVNQNQVLPKLRDDLVERFKDYTEEKGYTRAYNLMHRQYGNTPLKVVELLDGPKDTLKQIAEVMPKDSDKLESLRKSALSDVFTAPVDDLLQSLESQPRGRMHKKHAEARKMKEQSQLLKQEASKLESTSEMEAFAKLAIGQTEKAKKRSFAY